MPHVLCEKEQPGQAARKRYSDRHSKAAQEERHRQLHRRHDKAAERPEQAPDREFTQRHGGAQADELTGSNIQHSDPQLAEKYHKPDAYKLCSKYHAFRHRRGEHTVPVMVLLLDIHRVRAIDADEQRKKNIVREKRVLRPETVPLAVQ